MEGFEVEPDESHGWLLIRSIFAKGCPEGKS
jgi:hypothetical protein